MTSPFWHGAEVVALARSWIGTPYRHQASEKGQGADCLGVVRGVWREWLGPEPQGVPPYGMSPGPGEPDLVSAASHWLEPSDSDVAQPGEVLFFRMRPMEPARHCGILVENNQFVHAWSGRSVTASRLGSWWQRRMVARFRFPEGPVRVPSNEVVL